MGILEQVIGSVVGAKLGHGRVGGSPVMKALMMLLAAQAAKQVLTRRQGGAAGGGLGDVLGGVLGAGQNRDAGVGSRRDSPGGLGGALEGGLGGLLGGVAAGGGLGALIDHFTRNGYGSQAQSWVSTQPNQQISPHQLADALGPETVAALQEETGLPRDQVLAELSDTLPDTVDQLTPDGDLPHPDRLQ